jgi:hypothetical protein
VSSVSVCLISILFPVLVVAVWAWFLVCCSGVGLVLGMVLLYGLFPWYGAHVWAWFLLCCSCMGLVLVMLPFPV